MFGELEWWRYALIAALPVLGFALGARWMYWRSRLKAAAPPPQATPLPATPGFETRMLDAVDSVQRQLEELAERQDFAERMLAQRSALPPAPREEEHTPV